MLRIKFLRLSRRLSQGQVADLTGTPRQHLSQIENGIRNPRPGQLNALARVFQCASDTLLEQVVEALDVFFPGGFAERCVTEHRVYGLIYTNGHVHEDFTAGGAELVSLKTFPTVEDAKAWVEQDVQSRLAPRGGVS
jgi:transcriptional regulator with XRE-family HTH domain